MAIPQAFTRRYRNRKNTIADLADHFQVSRATISRWARHLKILRRPQRPRSPWDEELFRMMYKLGARYRDLGVWCCNGVSASSAENYARRLGLPKRNQSSGDVRFREAERLYVGLKLPLHRVASIMGHKLNTVRRVLEANGIQMRTKGGGSHPPMSKDPTVAQVVRFHRTNPEMSFSEISRRFGKDRDWAGRRLRFALSGGLTDRQRSSKKAAMHCKQ